MSYDFKKYVKTPNYSGCNFLLADSINYGTDVSKPDQDGNVKKFDRFLVLFYCLKKDGSLSKPWVRYLTASLKDGSEFNLLHKALYGEQILCRKKDINLDSVLDDMSEDINTRNYNLVMQWKDLGTYSVIQEARLNPEGKLVRRPEMVWPGYVYVKYPKLKDFKEDNGSNKLIDDAFNNI